MLLEIKSTYGSFDSQQAVREALYAIAFESQFEYAPTAPPLEKAKYKEMMQMRWNSEIKLKIGDLIRMGLGECHDSTLLAYLLGRTLREIDSRFRLNIIKTRYEAKGKQRFHFFLLVKAPDERLYVVDPIEVDSNFVRPVRDIFEPLFPENRPQYRTLEYIHSFNTSPKSCQQSLISQ